MQYKILIVDDETSNVEVMVDALKEQNHKIMVAVDGLSAYRIAQKTLPDLIIMDWEMANLNGIETIHLLKKNETTKDIPIIMATGKRLLAEDLKIALGAGAVDYIRKPFEKIELIARVRSVLLLFDTLRENLKLQLKIKDDAIYFLQKEVSEKNKDLAEKIMQAHRQEMQLDKMQKKITEIVEMSEKNETIQRKAKELIDGCKGKNADALWNEFQITFDHINENFYSSLIEQFPDISLTEKKICAFLKLNFNTKEIAEITQKSIDAVQKTRHRLRKRFNLNQDEDLTTFIQQL